MIEKKNTLWFYFLEFPYDFCFDERPALGLFRSSSTTIQGEYALSTLSKADLIKTVAAACDLKPAIVDNVLDALTREVTRAVTSGSKVTIPGLVAIERKERAARKGRNPKTGEELMIDASVTASARPVKALKDALEARKA